MSATRTATRGLANWLLLPFAFFSLSACGGGTTVAGGGIGGTGLTAGSITAFGSVFVNGIDFRTDATTVRKRLDDGPDNIPGADDVVFRKGMVVKVRHNPGDNNALEISFQDDFEGPASGVTATSLNVLGQTVLFDAATTIEFTGGTGPAIVNGDIVEVSGFPDNASAVRATYLQVKPAGSTGVFEIKGTITAPITGTPPDQSFTLKGLTVTTNASTVLKDLPAGLVAGDFVEVKTASTAGPLLAGSVEGKRSVADDAAATGAASIEGFVTGLSGADPNFTFALNGVTVTTSSATTGRAAVLSNAHVQAEGPIVGGVMQAEKISPRS